MEFTNTPRDVPPHRPTPGGSLQPTPQRRVFSDFAPRPAARPAAPRPVSSPAPAPQPAHMPRPAVAQPHAQSQSAPTPAPAPFPVADSEMPPMEPAQHEGKAAARSHGKRTHAGLVGFVCFLVFASLLLSPLLPGKILENFPGSSETVSNGDQTIGCAEDVTGTTLSLAYNSRAGSPIVYNYSATTTQKGSCDGRQQTAVAGRTSQFNPLGLAADLLLALLVAIGIAQAWRLLFRPKD